MSDLVGNQKSWFSHANAHFVFSDVVTFSAVTKIGIWGARMMISVDNSLVGRCSHMILSALIAAPKTVVTMISIRNKIHCIVLQNKVFYC